MNIKLLKLLVKKAFNTIDHGLLLNKKYYRAHYCLFYTYICKICLYVYNATNVLFCDKNLLKMNWYFDKLSLNLSKTIFIISVNRFMINLQSKLVIFGTETVRVIKDDKLFWKPHLIMSRPIAVLTELQFKLNHVSLYTL